MSQKLMPRLGSAIASTILSVFWAVSLVGVDKAQAAVLTFNFYAGGAGSGFFKLDNSSVTGIGIEEIAVFDGRLERGETYYNLAGARASFEQGNFLGLDAEYSNTVITVNISPPDEPGGPFHWMEERLSAWSIARASYFSVDETVRRNINYQSYLDDGSIITDSYEIYSRRITWGEVDYTLVDTEPSPVPEPLTAGGTALALAGLSWLKHKKKMAA